VKTLSVGEKGGGKYEGGGIILFSTIQTVKVK